MFLSLSSFIISMHLTVSLNAPEMSTGYVYYFLVSWGTGDPHLIAPYISESMDSLMSPFILKSMHISIERQIVSPGCYQVAARV